MKQNQENGEKTLIKEKKTRSENKKKNQRTTNLIRPNRKKEKESTIYNTKINIEKYVPKEKNKKTIKKV